MPHRADAGDEPQDGREVARKAARQSVDDFRRLHEMGCLWVVYS
ncbi:MAG: hypothetical protein R3B98_00365 [Hyphomonas sp.]